MVIYRDNREDQFKDNTTISFSNGNMVVDDGTYVKPYKIDEIKKIEVRGTPDAQWKEDS